ncbi:TPA: QueT transporter family protein [Candidatus Bathyarchaeota archaeon]|nr:QueT transporter family protein [Candidatus Bathyarchaeota archaeon]
MKARDLSLMAAIAALYCALVNVFHPISFLAIQVRVANALIGLVPLLGMPSVYGLALGVLLANITSPIGPIDLVSAIPTLVGCYLLFRIRDYSVLLGLSVYSLMLGLWVAYMLWLVFNVPYLVTFVYVFIGILIATAGLGYLVYKTAKRVVPKEWVG